MTARFTPIDLSGIPAPDVVETLSYETILAEMLADLKSRDNTFTATVESDPAYKILEVAAYRELLIRQRVNDAGRAVMLAYAQKADLDNLAAYYGVTRLVLDPGDATALPVVPPTYENDTDLRRRTQLALEGFTTAGSEGSYVFWGLGSHPQVKDISVSSPIPGEVLVTVLSRLGNGTPTTDILNSVDATLNKQDIRPLTDVVVVQGANVFTYQVRATLYLYAGPDPDVVQQTAQAQLLEYCNGRHKIGQRVALSGIYSALQVEGVERVELLTPLEDLVSSETQAAYCSGIQISTVRA